jgi:lipopolysaccharide/colanic/teichoic acid biosynthesis glycosyltransferase
MRRLGANGSQRASAGRARAQAAWAALDREIDRSRRHRHEVTLLRLGARGGDGADPRRLAASADRLRALIRSVDYVWFDGDGLFVLLPESGRGDADGLLKRLAAAAPAIAGAGAGEVSVATFPQDGLTANALRAAVSGPRPGAHALPLGRRAFDVVGSSLMLVLALPVMALCALAIRLDSPGPVVFGQMRTGRDGRRFRMWKFRTMLANAEELKAGLSHLNVLAPPDFKILRDPRITRVGRFLRATSLDELPQLANVLRGQMSLVGPRPTSFPASSYELWHTQRLDVAPGITGLWQLEGRNATSFDERLRLDARYIRGRSLRRDLVLLARTLGAIVHRSGA